MKEAFQAITQKTKINVKYNENLTKQQWFAHGAQDRNFFYDMYLSIFKSKPSNGYLYRMHEHNDYFKYNFKNL